MDTKLLYHQQELEKMRQMAAIEEEKLHLEAKLNKELKEVQYKTYSTLFELVELIYLGYLPYLSAKNEIMGPLCVATLMSIFSI